MRSAKAPDPDTEDKEAHDWLQWIAALVGAALLLVQEEND